MKSRCGGLTTVVACALHILTAFEVIHGVFAVSVVGTEGTWARGPRSRLKGLHTLEDDFPDASHQILEQLQHTRQRTDVQAAGDGQRQQSMDVFADPTQDDEQGSYSAVPSQPGLSDNVDPGKRAAFSASIRLQQVGGDIKPGRSTAPVHVSMVLLLTMLMAGCNGLGAVPFFFTGSLSKECAGLANAVACGVMLAASFDLLHEGEPHGPGLTILGLILGGAFIQATQQWLGQFEHVKFEGLQGAGARKTLLMVCIMAAHALGEGSGVGVSFCGDRGWAQGLLVTLAIGLHNIPEGLAVATVLVGKGVSVRQAMLWTLLTALPQPLVAVPAYLFVDSFRSLLPLALGFAAGCMVWMVFAELLPDALADAPHAQVATAGTLSAAWLEGLRMMLSSLERPDGTFAPPVNVDLRSAAPTCMYLILPVLPACLASGAFAALPIPSGALTLGMSAGLLMWTGAAEAGVQLFNPHVRAASAVLSTVCGGALLVLLWRAYGSASAGQGPAPLKKTDEDLEAPVVVVATAGAHVAAPYPSSGGWELVVPVNGHSMKAEDSMRGPSGKRSLPRRPVTAMPPRLNGDAAAGLLPVSSAALYSQRSMQQNPSPRTSTFIGFSAHQSAHVAGLGLLLVLLQGLSEGWLVGSLARDDPGTARLSLLPASLRAVLKGITAYCLMLTWPSQALGRRLAVAALAASIAPLVACTRILVDNKVLQPATGLHQAVQLAGRGAALTAGAMLVAASWNLYPSARAIQRRAAQRGLLLGLLGSIGIYLTLGLLCLLSPYCIRLPAVTSLAHLQ